MGNLNFRAGENLHESDRSLQNDVERLTLSNEALKAAIDNLAEKMNDSAVSEANSIYEQQKQKPQGIHGQHAGNDAAFRCGIQQRFHGSRRTHSSNNKIDKAMSATDWERVSKAAGISVRNAGEFWTLTSEQMYNVANEASDLYAKIKQHADDGHRDAAQYMDEYIEYWKQLEELEESLFEKQTDTPFDTLRNEFKDILLDMESDADDFAAKFSKSMQKAMIESMMSDTYSKQLKDWYKDFAGAMSKHKILTKGEKVCTENGMGQHCGRCPGRTGSAQGYARLENRGKSKQSEPRKRCTYHNEPGQHQPV